MTEKRAKITAQIDNVFIVIESDDQHAALRMFEAAVKYRKNDKYSAIYEPRVMDGNE